jgi:hypothetical protein
VIRDQVVSGLVSAADAALPSDGESSAMLAAEAARVEPDSTFVRTVRSRIEAQTRAQLAEQCLSASQGFQSAGDWQGALHSLDRGLAVYPKEPRLLESKEQIEGQIRKREEELRRVRDEDVRLREQDLRQKEARDQEAREKELRDQAQREEELRQAREQELREKQQRENEQRERARELEQSRWAPAPPISAERPLEAADAAAARIFLPGTEPVGPEVFTKSTVPVTPLLGITQDLTPPAAPNSSLHALGTHLTLGPSNILETKTSQTLRDAARPAKADIRTAFVETQPAYIEPGAGSDTLQEASLQIIERQLAAFIGPLAKVLVKRAASKTTSTVELYTILATHLEGEADRKTFLARRTELSQGKVTAAAPKVSSPPAAPAAAPLDSSSPGEITPAAIEQATRRLAAHLGPIAPILAKKEVKRATTLRNFYELLAEHVANPTERARFLKEAGVQEASPPPSFLSARYEAVAPAGQSAKSEPVEHTQPPVAHTEPVEESAEQAGEREPTRKAG